MATFIAEAECTKWACTHAALQSFLVEALSLATRTTCSEREMVRVQENEDVSGDVSDARTTSIGALRSRGFHATSIAAVLADVSAKWARRRGNASLRESI